MRVVEIARRCGASSDAVRYYTKLGILRPARDKGNGYRLYGPSDLARLRFVRRARTLGYKLDEISEILAASEKGESPCPLVRGIIERRLNENRRILDAAMALQVRMERAAAQWKRLPDGVPIGDSICHLIESVTEPADTADG
jgi:MerR family transcriptional regulator, Zn(II)-responsive regulator of zntA